jgi:hypothetical protein
MTITALRLLYFLAVTGAAFQFQGMTGRTHKTVDFRIIGELRFLYSMLSIIRKFLFPGISFARCNLGIDICYI